MSVKYNIIYIIYKWKIIIIPKNFLKTLNKIISRIFFYYYYLYNIIFINYLFYFSFCFIFHIWTFKSGSWKEAATIGFIENN